MNNPSVQTSTADKTVVKHIFVSPHSDDVALSCGGRIISNGARSDDTIVLNVFTSQGGDREREGAAIERALFDSINSERTSEDRSAWDSIGVESVHANLPEALLRRRFPFRLAGARDDPGVLDSLYDVLAPYVASCPNASFYFPAGFGNHVDHLACREVAFRFLDEGRLSKILLYEDVPYCWLKFIRSESYKILLRSIELDGASRETAFRSEGEDCLEYLRRKSVPFPRGKKLFLIVYASLRLGNAIRTSSGEKDYRGRVLTFRLDDHQLSMKKDLLWHYKSQIPMLFGMKPEELLQRLHECFAREVAIEITKNE